MDNKKIGDLIAKLRKAKGLTQQELGDMVGIGFRAVSKWERGITMPDISIINDLSKILGITSDELLSGELKKTNKSKENNKTSKAIKITISILTTIILIITAITLYFNNKTYVYEITQVDNADYHIEGQIIFKRKEMSIIVNKIMFLDANFSSVKIKDYQYEIYSNEILIFGYGQSNEGNYLEKNTTIEEVIKNIKINYAEKTDINHNEIINNNLIIKFYFIDENNQVIKKEIVCAIY